MLLLRGLTRTKRTKSLSSDVVIRDAILTVHQTLHLKTLELLWGSEWDDIIIYKLGMVKLKSKTQCHVELKEEDYLMLLENTIKMEPLIIAGIEKIAIYKAMEHILQHQHIDLLIKPVSRRYC